MKYRAKVTKVNKKNGTIKVSCPNVWGSQESPWCYPCVPFIHKAYTLYPSSAEDKCKCTVRIPGCDGEGKSSQTVNVNCKPKCKLKIIVRLPKVGENVWIEFEQDDVHSTPIYVGTWGDDKFWQSVWLED